MAGGPDLGSWMKSLAPKKVERVSSSRLTRDAKAMREIGSAYDRLLLSESMAADGSEGDLLTVVSVAVAAVFARNPENDDWVPLAYNPPVLASIVHDAGRGINVFRVSAGHARLGGGADTPSMRLRAQSDAMRTAVNPEASDSHNAPDTPTAVLLSVDLYNNTPYSTKEDLCHEIGLAETVSRIQFFSEHDKALFGDYVKYVLTRQAPPRPNSDLSVVENVSFPRKPVAAADPKYQTDDLGLPILRAASLPRLVDLLITPATGCNDIVNIALLTVRSYVSLPGMMQCFLHVLCQPPSGASGETAAVVTGLLRRLVVENFPSIASDPVCVDLLGRILSLLRARGWEAMAVTMEEAWAECEFEVFRFRHLRNLAQDMRAALPLEAHRWRLKTVECLTGDRIVAWLVEAGHASDSAEALAVGAELLRTKLLRSVAGEGVSVRFEDNSLALYQFHLVSDRLALMSFAKRKTFQPPPPPALPRLRMAGPPLTFEEIPVLELARQMTLLNETIYSAIQASECLGLAWSKEGKERNAPNVRAMIQRFNRESRWAATVVTRRKRLDDRLNALCRLLSLVQCLDELQNYSSVFAVMAGLREASVFRMTLMWDALDGELEAVFEHYKAFTSSIGNYGAYRERLRDTRPPAIPHMGVFLSDLTFIEDGNADLTGDGLINYDKRRRCAEIIQTLVFLQGMPYNLAVVNEIREHLVGFPVVPEDTTYEWSRTAAPTVADKARTSSKKGGSLSRLLRRSSGKGRSVGAARDRARDRPSSLRVNSLSRLRSNTLDSADGDSDDCDDDADLGIEDGARLLPEDAVFEIPPECYEFHNEFAIDDHSAVEASGSLDGAVGAVSVDGVYPLDAHLDLLGRAPGARRARNPDSRRGSRVIPPSDEGPSTSVAGETGGERDPASVQASPAAGTGSALARPSRKSLEERRPSLLNDPEADRRAHVAAKRVTTSNFAGLDLGIQSSGTPSRDSIVMDMAAEFGDFDDMLLGSHSPTTPTSPAFLPATASAPPAMSLATAVGASVGDLPPSGQSAPPDASSGSSRALSAVPAALATEAAGVRRPSKSGKGVKRDAATLGWLESGHPNAKKMTKLFSRLAVAVAGLVFAVEAEAAGAAGRLVEKHARDLLALAPSTGEGTHLRAGLQDFARELASMEHTVGDPVFPSAVLSTVALELRAIALSLCLNQIGGIEATEGLGAFMTLMNGYMELAAAAGGQGDLLAALKACLADTKAVTVTTADDAPDETNALVAASTALVAAFKATTLFPDVAFGQAVRVCVDALEALQVFVVA